MKKILTKQQLQDYAERHGDDPLTRDVVRMAEERRRSYYKTKRRKKRKPKDYLRPTDYLSLEQVGRIMDFVKAEESRTINRAVINEMLIVLLLETGMRASELCNLRLSGLPSYHGHLEIEVVDGKGRKDRTIRISGHLKKRLDLYVIRYHRGRSLDGLLFRNEQRKKMTRQSIYCKVKVIGLGAGIWIYNKNGTLKTRLSPHKFRHTFGTHLLDVTDNLTLVQEQLGHKNLNTTAIYAKTLSAKVERGMKGYSNRIRALENSDYESNM